MTFMSKNRGRYVKGVDFMATPVALRTCQRTGMVFPAPQVTEQMDWYGDSFMGVNIFVGAPYQDKPQEQNRPPKVKADPYPVLNPRFPDGYTPGDYPAPSTQEILNELNTLNWND